MKQPNIATRRGFLVKATSAVSAPLALAALGGTASADSRTAAEGRLLALEDENAIRALQLDYARRMNAAAPTRASADSSGSGKPGDATIAALVLDIRDAVQIAPDRRTATALLRCELLVETPIDAPGYSLVDLARLQGEGVLRHREPRALEQTFVREAGGWQIASSALKEPIPA